MKTIKFNCLTKAQKNAVQVLFITSNDEVKDIYLKLYTIDAFRAFHDSLLSVGFYGISFWVKDSTGEYTIKVVK